MTAPFTSKADFYEGSPIFEPDVPPAPAPVITSIDPTSYAENLGMSTINAMGTGFIQGCVVKMSGTVVPFITFVNSELIFINYQHVYDGVSQEDVVLNLTITNPDGQVSNAVQFTVTNVPSGA